MVLCLITASSTFYLQPGRSRHLRKCMRVQNCGRYLMKHADIRRHKIIPSSRVDAVGLEVFIVSDLHTEYAENMAWVKGLPKKGKKKEVLLVAGDVAETYEKFVLTMSLLKSSFEHVFFVPGNHDLWLRREKENYIDSLQKLDKMLDACQRLGVETNPSVIDCLAIIPLFSWYHESFDREKDITGIRIPSLELACKDFRACKWPEGLINGDNSLATHFDAMNDKNQDTVQEMIASCLQIISFSHFVPRLELCPEKRMLFYPNLPKLIGSDFLEARIRYIHGARGNTNACHIFGHTHFCWDVLLDGIRYVQAPLAYPRERKRRMNGGEEWLPFCIYSKVLGDASNSVRRSNTQCRWRSFAATVPADSAADRRKQKRVSMEERIAMVEGFVNKYRATNGGKFPSTKAAMKEVGGSYYTVKKIVQEMQYNAKMPVDKDTVVKEASARNAAIRKDSLVSKVEETLSSATSLEHEECEDGQLTNEILLDKEYNQNWKSSHELKQIPSDRQTIDGGISQETQSLTISGDTSSNREAEAKLQTPIAAEQILLQEMSRISGSDNKDAAAQVLGAEVKSHYEEPENNIKQKDSPMEDLKFDGLKQMDEQRHSPEPEKPTRELFNERKAETQAESKSSLWKNMKSFADGILNMWWKQ